MANCLSDSGVLYGGLWLTVYQTGVLYGVLWLTICLTLVYCMVVYG